MKKIVVLLVALVVALTALPTFAADLGAPPPPSRFSLWGSVTAVDATAKTLTVSVLVYRGRGEQPASVTLSTNERTRFAKRTADGVVRAAFSDVAIGQTVMVNGAKTQAGSMAQMVLINAEVPPQPFMVGGQITAIDSTAKTLSVKVTRVKPSSLGIQPGSTVTIATTDKTRYCAASEQGCTTIAFTNLAVNDWIGVAGGVVNNVLTARQVTKMPAAPPQ